MELIINILCLSAAIVGLLGMAVLWIVSEVLPWDKWARQYDRKHARKW